MRMIGVEVRAVDLRGNERLSPQSPLASDAGVVSIAACIGYGRVAVAESNRWDAVRVALGRGSGGGNENNREFLKRFPVGDSFCVAIPQPRRHELRDSRRLHLWIIPRRARGACQLGSQGPGYYANIFILKLLAFILHPAQSSMFLTPIDGISSMRESLAVRFAIFSSSIACARHTNKVER